MLADKPYIICPVGKYGKAYQLTGIQFYLFTGVSGLIMSVGLIFAIFCFGFPSAFATIVGWPQNSISLFFLFAGLLVVLFQFLIASNGVPISRYEFERLISEKPQNFRLNPSALIVKIGVSLASGFILALVTNAIIYQLSRHQPVKPNEFGITIICVIVLFLPRSVFRFGVDGWRSIRKTVRIVAIVFLLLITAIAVLSQLSTK